MTRGLGKYYTWKEYLGTMITIALPVAMQNLLSTTASMVDTIMLGNKGELAVAAVSGIWVYHTPSADPHGFGIWPHRTGQSDLWRLSEGIIFAFRCPDADHDRQYGICHDIFGKMEGTAKYLDRDWLFLCFFPILSSSGDQYHEGYGIWMPVFNDICLYL